MAHHDLVVCIWSIDTQAVQSMTLQARIDAFKNAVGAAYGRVKELRDTRQKPWGIFVAPEYLFAHPARGGHHELGEKRHLLEPEKINLLAMIQHVSVSCPGLIIVPGTVAWQKPLLRPADKRIHTKGHNAGQEKLISRNVKAMFAVTSYATQHNAGRMDVSLSGDLYIDQDISVAAIKGHQKIDVLRRHLRSAGQEDLQMARNTAYVFYDGALLLKYNKHADFHEVLNSANVVYIPGAHPGVFYVRTEGQEIIKFGIEVCLDHAVGVLETTVLGGGRVDVHIVVSAWVDPNRYSRTVKPGGCMIHASSNVRLPKVYNYARPVAAYGHGVIDETDNPNVSAAPIAPTAPIAPDVLDVLNAAEVWSFPGYIADTVDVGQYCVGVYRVGIEL